MAVKQAKLEFDAASNAAKVASLVRQRDKAKADVELWKGRLDRMERGETADADEPQTHRQEIM